MRRSEVAAVVRGRLSRTTAVGAIVVFPLAGAWWTADATTAMRAIVLGVVVALAAVIGVASPPRSVAVAAAAVVAVFVIAALTSATPLLSLLGRFPRYEGLLWLLACLIVASQAMGMERPVREVFIPRCFTVLAVILAVSGAFDSLVTPDLRIRTPLGNASDAGALAIVCLSVGLTLPQGPGGRRWNGWQVACVGASLLTVVLSASRGALLAAVGVLALSAGYLLVARRGRRVLLPLGLALLTAVASFLAPMTRSRLLGESPLASATVNGRLVLWSDTWQLITAQPLLGVGPSRFVDAINQYHGQRWVAVLGDQAPPDSPHNLLLQLLASTGLLGLCAGLALVATVLWCWWRHRDEGAVAAAALAVAGLAVALSAHTTSPSVLLPAVVLVGMSLSAAARPAPLWPRFVAGAVAATLLIVGAMLVATESRLAVAVERAAALEPGTQQALTEIRQQTGDPDLARRVAFVQVGLGWKGESVPDGLPDDLSQICGRLPGSVECVLVLGQALELQGRLDEAAMVLASAAERSPNHSLLMLNRAIIDAQRGELELAETQLLRLTTLAPQSAAPWHNLSMVYAMMERPDDAAKASERAAVVEERG